VTRIMTDYPRAIAPQFNSAATMTARSANVQARVDRAMQRMNAHFEKCEPQLTQSRYRDLLTKQGTSPELKPASAMDNASDRMWRAAQKLVKFDHARRLNKIRDVGQRMMGKDRAIGAGMHCASHNAKLCKNIEFMS
jgi:hypothetical protein